MNRKNSLPVIIAGLLMIFLVSNCKKQESPEPTGNGPSTNNPTVPANPYNPPAVTFSAPVKGFVTDGNNQPIPNATVVTGNKTTTTDENGAFEIDNAAFTGNFCYIKAVKTGYFTGSTTIHGKSTNVYTTQLVLSEQNNITSYKATESKNITLSGGASINMPANGIKKLDGSPYTGNVHVAVMHIDPAAPDFSMLIPGGDLRAYSSQGVDVQLYSYGMLNVELKDDAGNYLQLADGKKATLTMPVPASMTGTAPSTIPLWYFDENKGVWIEEGSALLKNGSYEGTVSHFTPWNCDQLGGRAIIKGKFKDCNNETIAQLSIEVSQGLNWTDSDGSWESWVLADRTHSITVHDGLTLQKTKLSQVIPAINERQTYDMGTITVPCRQKLTGTITDCDGNPFNGYAILKTPAGTIRSFVEKGQLNLRVFSDGETAELYFYQPAKGQLKKVTITLPAKDLSKDLGVVQVCATTSVNLAFSFDYDDGNGVKSVSLSNITQASGTLYTGTNLLSMHFGSFNNNKENTASFVIRNPKVGSNPVSPNDSIRFRLAEEDLYFYLTGSNFTFNIVKYQGPGGEISGTFSGSMFLYDGSSYKNAVVTNGKFSAVRLPDE